MAQQAIPAAQVVPRFHTIGRCNNYAVLQSIPCSPECKIVGKILPDHPLSYDLTATVDVPVVYIQQFWRTVRKVPVDMFRDILHLPLETPENPFVSPVNIETIEAFMNKVGYQGVVDKVSAFYTNILAQPWQTMFKVFNRCLTIRTSGHDQTKINILQMFHAVINRTNVDYAALLWIEEDYHSIKDDIPLVNVYTTRNVLVRGMLIMNAILTEEIHAFDDFKEYETVFMNVDVLMNQPQLVVSTQGMHRLEPESHKDKPEYVNDDDDDDKGAEKATKELIENNLKPCSAATIIEDRDTFRSEVPDLVSQEFNAQEPKIIEELFKNYVQGNVIQVHPTTITSTKTTSSTNLQQQLYFKMKRSLQDRANDPALWEVLKRKFEKYSTSNTSCRKDEIHSHHDDHQEDDAPPEGEKRVKRHKASKSSKSARGSSSKHSAKDSTTYVSNQQQQQQWDAWVEETIIDEDEVIPKDETPELIIELQDVDKRVLTIFDYDRIKATLNDALSNQFKNAEEYAYHLEQTTNFIENQIVWESRQEDIRRLVSRPLVFFGPQRNPNKPPRYLYNKDLFFLKYGNTKEKKYILSLYKIHAECFLEVDLEENMNRWVRKEFKTFNEDARLTIQHWKDSWHKRVYKQNQRKVRNNPEDYLSNHRITEVNREPLSEDILGATTQRYTGSYYPKRYWELLPKEILGAITETDTRSYYPKRYCELLPKERLGCLMGKWRYSMNNFDQSTNSDSSLGYSGPTIEDTSITQADLHPSVNPVAGEPSSAQSTSRDVSLAEPNQVTQPPDHLRRWTKDHPLDNIVGNLFSSLQVSQSPRGIFINQAKYALETLKKYGMNLSDPVVTKSVDRLKTGRDLMGIPVDQTDLEECLCSADHADVRILREVRQEVLSFLRLDCTHRSKAHRQYGHHFIKSKWKIEGLNLLRGNNYNWQISLTKLYQESISNFYSHVLGMKSYNPETSNAFKKERMSK
ncbi:hypothetical protein Tco_0615612 [Tanacetum coccineum]